MKPLLFEVFGLKFHAYPVMLAAAFLVSTLLIVRAAQRQNPPLYISPQGGLWVYIGAIVGAKVFYILQFHEWTDLWHAVILWEGGLVYYGGLVGGVLAVLVYLIATKTPRFRAGDVIVAYLPLGQAITRLGCFLNGCCWGTETSVPWAVRFPKGSAAYWMLSRKDLVDTAVQKTFPLHPTQLYMAAGLIAIFLVLQYALKRKQFDGGVLLLYCLLYGILRFVVEFYRGDSARSVLHMTVSQVISLLLVIGAVVACAVLRFVVLRRPLYAWGRRHGQEQSRGQSGEVVRETS